MMSLLLACSWMACEPVDECPGATLCDGTCVNIEIDPSNCGACGDACADGNICVDGQCGLVCYGGTTLCADACVDTTSNSDHCGACDSACPVGEVCSESQCGLNCVGGTTNCDGVCINLTLNIDHCGACNQACAGDQVCAVGVCTDPETVQLPVLDQGWHATFNDGHDAESEQLSIGAVLAPDQGYISGFLVVDTATMPDVVVTARLRLLMTNYSDFNDAVEAIEAWDVSTPINTLTASGSSEAIVDDLRSGTSYGMRLVDVSLRGQVFEFELNQAAVDMLNNANGSVAIGLGFATPADGAAQIMELATHAGRNAMVVTGFNP